MPLPPFGWTAHSEQTDVASLDARVWRMETVVHGGCRVLTVLLEPPDAATARKLELIAQHKKTCTNPHCRIGIGIYGEVLNDIIGPDGKFNTAALVFTTHLLDPTGRKFEDATMIAKTPEIAVKNHHDTVAITAGMIGLWAAPEDLPV